MNGFFCAEESRQAGEEIIGCATNHKIYVLIECPPPWTPNALDSKFLPANLKALKEEIDTEALSVRFVLIHSNQLKCDRNKRLIIFRAKTGLSAGYTKQEFLVSDINDIASLLKDCLTGNTPEQEAINIQTRDILVCTHGSHDKCCAKYGNPFYKAALATVSDLSLDRVRVWQASHIGGHRFAPTAIDFPEGRYYGRLNQESFAAILTRTGDIQCLNHVYRGWGILPWSAQILEKELILKHGWDWFNYKVGYQIIDQNEDESFNQVEITFETPNGALGSYRAEIVEDKNKTLHLKGECDGTESYKFTQFDVKNMVIIPQ
ncbi:sucrase ferredoxin [Coleofasciculus sp. FACHB-1120]|uniref:sucrase ferredoxin n=1 Tax=Coleofasciculus sp. FACHB-1120 TaxID=2692783 RepID=UPI00168900B9|nr:sucrase ferredoxin [Coleofasciculus sp. FACHB-1120]MBD2741466.1 sucrase ferredoxin [Coleofasciculus sp. FACHB-1120]